MKIISSAGEMQQLAWQWRREGKTVGFVPTMGALHEGHISLVQASRGDNEATVVSVFVNPTQFGPNEDLAKYPRPFERDMELLGEAGCDVVFAPQASELYGHHESGAHPIHTWVEVDKLGEIWEGVVRPGHLRGVATVVAKLLNIVLPQRAYFGEKDYQQLKVVQRLADDLFFDTQIVPCPTMRAADGLALSSRNAYLSAEERAAALTLWRAMQCGMQLAAGGENDVPALSRAMQAVCEAQPLVALQYVAIVDAQSLASLATLNGTPARILIAATVGKTRLIDNIAL